MALPISSKYLSDEEFIQKYPNVYSLHIDIIKTVNSSPFIEFVRIDHMCKIDWDWNPPYFNHMRELSEKGTVDTIKYDNLIDNEHYRDDIESVTIIHAVFESYEAAIRAHSLIYRKFIKLKESYEQ